MVRIIYLMPPCFLVLLQLCPFLLSTWIYNNSLYSFGGTRLDNGLILDSMERLDLSSGPPFAWQPFRSYTLYQGDGTVWLRKSGALYVQERTGMGSSKSALFVSGCVVF
jgi:hypothetical protein